MGYRTWLVGEAWGEEEALLGRGGGSEGALVVREQGDHQGRHVTLDLRADKWTCTDKTRSQT